LHQDNPVIAMTTDCGLISKQIKPFLMWIPDVQQGAIACNLHFPQKTNCAEFWLQK